MTRTPLCFDDVVRVCSGLEASGQRPSLRRVREELGRGSLTTIHGFMTRWRTEQQQIPAMPVHDAIRALEALAPSAVPGLRDAFRAEVAAERAATQESLRQAQQSVAELNDSMMDLERERDQALEHVRTLEHQLGSYQALQESVSRLGPTFQLQLEAMAGHVAAASEHSSARSEAALHDLGAALRELRSEFAASDSRQHRDHLLLSGVHAQMDALRKHSEQQIAALAVQLEAVQRTMAADAATQVIGAQATRTAVHQLASLVRSRVARAARTESGSLR